MEHKILEAAVTESKVFFAISHSRFYIIILLFILQSSKEDICENAYSFSGSNSLISEYHSWLNAML